MENLIHKFIEQNIKGVDAYQHNGSTWLIFTNDKRWVIELTKDNTLWYNYNFFKSIFEFFSMDLVENQHYITKWVEDNIINKVNSTHRFGYGLEDYVEDTIQNGVKEIKEVSDSSLWNEIFKVNCKKTIKNGVKETLNTEFMPKLMIEDTIQNGVKETNCTNFPNGNCGYVKEILRKGVKIVRPLPAQDGNRDWGNYYHDKEDRTKPFNEYVNDTIKFGVKETKHMDEWVNTDNIIKKVIKDGEIDTNTIS